MDGGIDHEQVVGAVDLGVQVHDAGAVALAAVVNTHLSAADPVVTADQVLGDDVLDG